MRLSYPQLRARVDQEGLLPKTRLARTALYLLGLDLFLYVLEKILNAFHSSWGQSLGGWVSFLTFVFIILFLILFYRWVKSRLLWRLRNRLIVTYVFIGVIPAVLLLAMGAASLYLFSGQFANFVVTSELNSQLRAMEAVNAAIGNELASRLTQGAAPNALSLEGLRRNEQSWMHMQVCAWLDGKPLPVCGREAPFPLPPGSPRFGEIARDGGKLYLRAAGTFSVDRKNLVVVSSELLDRDLGQKIAEGLGEITLYGDIFDLKQTQKNSHGSPPASGSGTKSQNQNGVTLHFDTGTVQKGNEGLRPTFTAGRLPAPVNALDREITFGTPLPVVDWQSGELQKTGAVLRVQTRPSLLYARLFAALGDFAKGVEYLLLFIAIVFAIIELIALIIGTRLTRTVTKAVAQLYQATLHINRGDFRHRIPVQSKDQLATLANSFNSMTASIEKLIEEQKQKQRLENELAIAQEVQAQLFPQHITQLQSLEVHGFCRPARTVSGDYYDFLGVDAQKLLLAVGDVSGKGISAALLMATIHSAVRAYSLEGIPAFRQPVAIGAESGSALMFAPPSLNGAEMSASTLLTLLNRQLYASTPAEKYATLFLAVYDGVRRQLTYSNGGHLPPFVIAEDGSLRRLDRGGTVVGLFDNMEYEEAAVQLRHGDIFVAYSDGVTEPENDFGEFGEARLIDLLREHRDLPLARISENVTAAVDDWIGASEQPDDITLVLARVR